MPRLQWSEELAIGDALIDGQHKDLIGRVNALLDAMAKGQGKAEVAKTIQFLGSYVATHFADEEKLMLSTNYPGYAAQKIQHTAFTRELKTIVAQLDAQGGNAALAIQVQQRVGDWLVNHIAQVDKKLGVYLARRQAV